MARSEIDMQRVLARSFAGFKLLAENSIGPAQKRVSREYAGNCLWALGIDEHSGIQAVKPDGDTIDLAVTRLLTSG
jgi:hypothetical protein